MADPAAEAAVAGEARPLRARVRHLLPQGQTLPDDVWLRRHHVLLGLLWAHAVGLAIFAVVRGYPVVHGVQEGLLIAAPALLATFAGSRKRLAAGLVSFGLITSSAVLVHIWGGVIEGHFHFFVMIVILSLYEDWLPFLLAAAYVVVHHGLAGALDPGSVYNHANAVAHPWKWALIHAFFVTGAGLGSVAAWRLNEDVRAETRRAYRRARESEERFKSAFENAPIGMVLVGIEPGEVGRFLQVNRELCAITGYSEEALLAKGLVDLIEPGDAPASTALLSRVAAGELPSFHIEQRYVRLDGRVVSGQLSLSLVRDDGGQPLHAIAQVQDITDRKRAQEQLAYQANHDLLTGLPNRRKLMEDLATRLAEATREEPVLLIISDLDGFKVYNDAFGHPAGDALLNRLGQRLQAAVSGRGVAYRMGGDEFCVLARLGVDGSEALGAATSAALSDHGEGFTITATHGSVVLPSEARDESEALRKADQRMYSRKSSARASAGKQATDALLRALSERDMNLGAHLNDVTELCDAVARRLGLEEEEMTPLLQAAALHDVGKVAIPDSILDKPAALDPNEWAFMKTHTLIGERILGAAPALAQAAKIVRSTHERMDGTGYPDGLAGGEIPLGSRIIAACDAYDAMTSDRPYRTAMSTEGAVEELRRASGTQFDPRIVEAVVAVLEGDRSFAVADEDS